MRIRWSSLSNRKPASALHSSVLPTPVGPRNRKEPVGRFGSLRPSANGGWRWPPRQWLRPARPRARAACLPSAAACPLALHQLGHGNAGGARHHLGDLLGADLGAQQPRRRRLRCGLAFLGLGFLQALFQLGQLAVLQLGHLVEVALAGELLDLERSLSISSRTWALPWAWPFSAFQISSRSAISFCSLPISSLISSKRFCEASSFSA
jgi:hypothetical protein